MSKWRDKYKVHPAADVFPMMSDEELDKLGEDIKAHGLSVPISIWRPDYPRGEEVLLDGRNRLEAMERAGIEVNRYYNRRAVEGDPVAHIIACNIHRRHLTKQQQADLIVAAHKAAEEAKAKEKPRQVEEVSKGGRGKRNRVKEKAVADAAKACISKSTVERSFAKRAMQKVKGKTSKPKTKPKKGVSAKKRCEGFLGWISNLDIHNVHDPLLATEVLNLLSEEEKARAVSILEAAIKRYQEAIELLTGPQAGRSVH